MSDRFSKLRSLLQKRRWIITTIIALTSIGLYAANYLSSDLILRNPAGVALARVDKNGNLFLAGSLRSSQSIDSQTQLGWMVKQSTAIRARLVFQAETPLMAGDLQIQGVLQASASIPVSGNYCYAWGKQVGFYDMAVDQNGNLLIRGQIYEHVTEIDQFDSSTAVAQAPTDLQVATVAETAIGLTWKNNGPANAIEIQRSIDGIQWQAVKTISGSLTAFTDQNLIKDTTYQYRVRASNANGFSPFSNTVTATTDDANSLHVSAVKPPANSISATVDTDMEVWFNQIISGASVSSGELNRQKEKHLSYTLALGSPANSLIIQPTQNLIANEKVSVTIRPGLVSAAYPDQVLEKPYVWQFLTKAGKGPGIFEYDLKGFGYAGESPLISASADFNADGFPDIIVGYAGYKYNIFLNQGGVFKSDNGHVITFIANSTFPGAVEVADLNNNGVLDIITLGQDGEGVIYPFVNGAVASGVRFCIASSVKSSSMAIADFNGDGYLDIVVANDNGKITLYKNKADGTPTFEGGLPVEMSFPVYSIRAGDINLDGTIDLVATGFLSGALQSKIAVLRNDALGNFAATIIDSNVNQAKVITEGDVNHDNKLDLVVAGYGNTYVYYNTGIGSYVETSGAFHSIASTDYWKQIGLADMDGDGNLDLIAGIGSNQSYVYLNRADGLFEAGKRPIGIDASNFGSFGISDFDRDGDLDVVLLLVDLPNELCLNSSPQLSFSEPFALNSNAATDAGDDKYPDLTCDSNGNWLAAWESNNDLNPLHATAANPHPVADYDLHYSQSTGSTFNWQALHALNSDADSDQDAPDGTYWENDSNARLATDKLGHWLGLWNAARKIHYASMADIYSAHSSDNGTNWSDPINVRGEVSEVPTDSRYDMPVCMATDGNGRWIGIYSTCLQDYKNHADEDEIEKYDKTGMGADQDLLYISSTNNGDSWSNAAMLNSNAMVDLPHGDPNDPNSSPWIVEDPAARPLRASDDQASIRASKKGTWIVAWQSNSNLNKTLGLDFDILFTRGTLNTATNAISWTDAKELNTDAEDDQRTHVFAEGPTDEHPELIYDGKYAGDGMPSVATDNYGNWVVAWFRNTVVSEDPYLIYNTEIMASTSTNDGVTWQAPVQVNSYNAADNVATDMRPNIACDAKGTWIITWQTSVDDAKLGVTATPAVTTLKTVFSQSSDIGRTWSMAQPAYPKTFHLNNGSTQEPTVDLFPQVRTDGNDKWIIAWESRTQFAHLPSDPETMVSIGADLDIIYTYAKISKPSLSPEIRPEIPPVCVTPVPTPLPQDSDTYYVNASGSMSGDGSSTNPYKSLQMALDDLKNNGIIGPTISAPKNINIIVQGKQILTPNILGLNQIFINYDYSMPDGFNLNIIGEDAEFSGGIRITNWVKNNTYNWWEASVGYYNPETMTNSSTSGGGNLPWITPDVSVSGKNWFRQLYISGRPAIRAREPNLGVGQSHTSNTFYKIKYVDHENKRISFDHDATHSTIEKIMGLSSLERQKVETVILHAWATSRLRIKQIEDDSELPWTSGDYYLDFMNPEKNYQFAYRIPDASQPDIYAAVDNPSGYLAGTKTIHIKDPSNSSAPLNRYCTFASGLGNRPYFITEYDQGNATLSIEPGLKEEIPDNTPITIWSPDKYGDCDFTHNWSSNDQATFEQKTWENIRAFPAKVGEYSNQIAEKEAVYFENSKAFIDSPGEWYLDTENQKVIYIPFSEDLSEDGLQITSEIVSPFLKNIIFIHGELGSTQSSNSKRAKNIRFFNIKFQHTMNSLFLDRRVEYFSGMVEVCPNRIAAISPASSYEEDYDDSDVLMSASVFLTAAENITFEDCIFKRLGGIALYLSSRTKNNVFNRNIISNISGCGIYEDGGDSVTGSGASASYEDVEGSKYTNNLIEKIGAEYYGSSAIALKYSARTLIESNEIRDLPYCAIWTGYGLNKTGQPEQPLLHRRENVIRQNEIHNIMLLMGDGGAIYTYGINPDNIYDSNYLYGFNLMPWKQPWWARCNGFYFDHKETKGADGKPLQVINNIIYGLDTTVGDDSSWSPLLEQSANDDYAALTGMGFRGKEKEGVKYVEKGKSIFLNSDDRLMPDNYWTVWDLDAEPEWPSGYDLTPAERYMVISGNEKRKTVENLHIRNAAGPQYRDYLNRKNQEN